MESKFETVLPSVTRTAQSDSSITTGKIILSKYFSISEISASRCPERNVLTQFLFDPSVGVSTSRLYSMFRFPDSNTVHLQCDILLCDKENCEEPLCVTDPDSETGRSLPAPTSASDEEDDKTRMMASTTVFVVEPGVTALGKNI